MQRFANRCSQFFRQHRPLLTFIAKGLEWKNRGVLLQLYRIVIKILSQVGESPTGLHSFKKRCRSFKRDVEILLTGCSESLELSLPERSEG